MSATLLPLTMPTVLKLLAALLSVMLLAAPAASVVTPATVSGPLWVRAPLVVTLNVPEMVEAREVEGIGIGQRHVVAAGDADGAEVVRGVIEGDVVGRAGGERGHAGHGQRATLGQRAIGRHA